MTEQDQTPETVARPTPTSSWQTFVHGVAMLGIGSGCGLLSLAAFQAFAYGNIAYALVMCFLLCLFIFLFSVIMYSRENDDAYEEYIAYLKRLHAAEVDALRKDVNILYAEQAVLIEGQRNRRPIDGDTPHATDDPAS